VSCEQKVNMNINRHNYEECFLLYIDNELTVEQKKQVELFVKENPDVEEEWVMLQQSKLIPDNTMVFEEKHILMKDENNSFINLNNYEEWLVLYVDNELNTEEKKIVEKFAAAHPHVQTDLGLFRQTKLGTEKEFSFPNKELLYRKEEKVKIISIRWWRVAAAAILIIAAGVTMYSVFNKANNGGAGMVNNERPGTKKEHVPDSIEPLPTARQQQKQNSDIKKEEKEQVAAIRPASEKPGEKDQQKVNNKNLRSNNKEQALANKDVPQKRPVFVNEINTIKVAESRINNDVVIGDKMHKQFFNGENVTPDPHGTPNLPEYASNTENKRLRGFFRKATRLIERTSGINPANDDDRVLIGGMAINLK